MYSLEFFIFIFFFSTSAEESLFSCRTKQTNVITFLWIFHLLQFPQFFSIFLVRKKDFYFYKCSHFTNFFYTTQEMMYPLDEETNWCNNISMDVSRIISFNIFFNFFVQTRAVVPTSSNSRNSLINEFHTFGILIQLFTR